MSDSSSCERSPVIGPGPMLTVVTSRVAWSHPHSTSTRTPPIHPGHCLCGSCWRRSRRTGSGSLLLGSGQRHPHPRVVAGRVVVVPPAALVLAVLPDAVEEITLLRRAVDQILPGE